MTTRTKYDRNLLSHRCMQAFAKFAQESGETVRAGKGKHQMLQIKISGSWLAICTDDKYNVSTPPAIRDLIKRFKENRKFTKPPHDAGVDLAKELRERHEEHLRLIGGIEHPAVIESRSPTDQTEAGQYAADLRDDAAIEFMGSLLLKSSNPVEATDEHIALCARTAYRMADALLVAGGHS